MKGSAPSPKGVPEQREGKERSWWGEAIQAGKEFRYFSRTTMINFQKKEILEEGEFLRTGMKD